jgi:DNA-binding NarL/FixJ family response regulator
VGAAIRVLVVDDHAIVRHGLTSYLSVAGDLEVVGEAGDGAEAVARVGELRAAGRGPDVVLVDLVMPGLDGIGVAEGLRQLPEPPRVMILSSFGDVDRLRAALGSGVSGYVLKSTSADDIVQAVRDVGAGKLYFDPALSSSLTKVVSAGGMRVSLTTRERDVVAVPVPRSG